MSQNQIYLPPTSSVESFHGKSELRRNLNSNLNNLIIGFCHQSYAFSRIDLNGYWLLLLGDFKEWVCWRGREMIFYWCMPLFLPCFLYSLYHFLSFSLFFLLLVSFCYLPVGCSYYYLAVGCAPLSSSMATSLFYSELI